MSFVMTTNKNARQFRWCSIALLTLGMCSGAVASSPSDPQCPSGNFAEFAQVFSSQPEIQKASIASSVQELRVVADGDKPKVVQRNIKALDAAELNVLVPENAAASSLTIKVDLPNKLIVRDQAGKFLKVFVFKHGDCWVLDRVEDWSLENVSDVVSRTEKLLPGQRELRKGAWFDRLANHASPESGVYLYAAALDSYLAGAQEGSPQAALAAAGISLSGQAPRLDNSKIVDLLIAASKSIPDAGVTLANFYCDEGEYDDKHVCINPQQSMAALESAASRGSVDALSQLGEVYEVGTVVPADLPRAMACYQEVQKKDPESGTRGVDHLAAQGVVADNSIQCLKAGSFR
jgi:hypothetical protein